MLRTQDLCLSKTSSLSRMFGFYARKQLLLSAHLSHRSSVCLSVCLSVHLSVRHMGGSVKSGAS